MRPTTGVLGNGLNCSPRVQNAAHCTLHVGKLTVGLVGKFIRFAAEASQTQNRVTKLS